jgi:hypothetical protein
MCQDVAQDMIARTYACIEIRKGVDDLKFIEPTPITM